MNIFKRTLRIITYVIFTCCIIGLIFCGISSDKLRLVTYQYKTNKDINFSCLVISDYHHRSLNFSNGNMIDFLNKQETDYVFFTGDLIDSHTKNLDDVTKIFESSKKIATKGCYFVTGNHEEYAPHWSKLQELMNHEGIRYLNDQEEVNNNLHIFGLQDARFKTGGGASFKARQEVIRKTLNTFTIDKNNFNVLLVHRPENFKMIADNYPFDLVISGHTHGGQFKLGNWIPGALFQEEDDYMGGEYHRNNTNLYVSRGLGYSAMLPIRVDCDPEIIKITISKA